MECNSTLQNKWTENLIIPLDIITHFQPIISINSKRIVALEALSRYRCSDQEDFSSIHEIITCIENETELLALDWILIKKAAESFANLGCDPGTLLFINISSAFVQEGIQSIEKLLSLLKEVGISSRQVVLEILEDNLKMDRDDLFFFEYCRDSDFLIALDDMGVGFSNLERIALIRPDIIKLDRCLVQDIQNDYYKMKVFESLIRLANDIGAIPLAEGVENGMETRKCLELGASLIQGFYFCRPAPSFQAIEEISLGRISAERDRFKTQLTRKRKSVRKRIINFEKIVEQICRTLILVKTDEDDKTLQEYIRNSEEIECLYILNRDGIQTGNTITIHKDYRKKHFLFQPARKGTDHSLKPYFFEPEGKQRLQISTPYISQASGKSCITLSRAFIRGDEHFLLCADFPDNSHKETPV